MSVLKVDLGAGLAQSGDKIEKILPLLVAAGFAAHGAYRGSGADVDLGINDPRKWRSEGVSFDPSLEFNRPARIEDPLTGGYLYSHEMEDPNVAQRILGGAVGATQGLNPFGLAGKVAGKGAKGIRTARATRAAREGQQARTAGETAVRARADQFTRASDAARAAERADPALTRVGNVTSAPWNLPTLPPSPGIGTAHISRLQSANIAAQQRRLHPHATHSIDEFGNPVMTQNPYQIARERLVGIRGRAGERALSDTSRALGSKWGLRAGRATQLLGPVSQALEGIQLPSWGGEGLGPSNVDVPFAGGDTSAYGGGGATPYGESGLGAGYGGMGVSNVSSLGTPEQDIWRQGGQQEWSGQFGGGSQMKTGIPMDNAWSNLMKHEDPKAEGRPHSTFDLMNRFGGPPAGDEDIPFNEMTEEDMVTFYEQNPDIYHPGLPVFPDEKRPSAMRLPDYRKPISLGGIPAPGQRGGRVSSELRYPMGNFNQGYEQPLTPRDRDTPIGYLGDFPAIINEPYITGYPGKTYHEEKIETGENMNIGEQMLKEAKARMLEKDDKKDDKKPKGGGIVLVIGQGKGAKKKDDSDKDGPC
jgi:hypothetical protein